MINLVRIASCANIPENLFCILTVYTALLFCDRPFFCMREREREQERERERDKRERERQREKI